MAVSRRRWMIQGVGSFAGAIGCLGVRPGAVAAAQGLEQFGTGEPPCTTDPRLTPTVPLDATFKPNAPRRARLTEPGMPGVPFRLSGTVSGVTCGRIGGARVDLWQADSRGVVDAAGFRLRGHQLTDAEGRFAFETIEPGAPGGRAKRFGLRVQVTGKLDVATELFFPDDPAAPRDPRFKKELVLRLVRAATGRAGVFDVFVAL